MWKYHEDYNYYDCFLGEHRLAVQPLTDIYSVRLYLGKEQSVEIFTHIHANSIEEAQNEAITIVRNHALRKEWFWNNLVYITDGIVQR